MKINFNIIDGKKCIFDLPLWLKKYNFNNPLILIDKNLLNNSPYIKKFIIFFKKFTFLKILYDYDFEPSYEYLDNLKKQIKNFKNYELIDVIICIGGGSTIDTGKGLSIILKNPGKSIVYRGFPTYIKKNLPLIAIPSTTGTGSEVTYNASFIDTKTKIKMGINYENNYPILTLLDPLIVKDMPLNVLRSSGCDLLVHTLESFMSKKSNELTRELSIKAYTLISKSFLKILSNKGSINDWKNLQWACVWSMIAMSNSSAGPASAFSYLLGTHFRINHGIAGAFFLKKIIHYNYKNNYIFSRLKNKRSKKDNKKIVKEIIFLLNKCKIPDDIENLGVKRKEDLGLFFKHYDSVKNAFNFNPLKIKKKEFLEIIFRK